MELFKVEIGVIEGRRRYVQLMMGTAKFLARVHNATRRDGPDGSEGIRCGDNDETSSNIYMDLYFVRHVDRSKFIARVIEMYRFRDLPRVEVVTKSCNPNGAAFTNYFP